jgi:hypothetical protein
VPVTSNNGSPRKAHKCSCMRRCGASTSSHSSLIPPASSSEGLHAGFCRTRRTLSTAAILDAEDRSTFHLSALFSWTPTAFTTDTHRRAIRHCQTSLCGTERTQRLPLILTRSFRCFIRYPNFGRCSGTDISRSTTSLAVSSSRHHSSSLPLPR